MRLHANLLLTPLLLTALAACAPDDDEAETELLVEPPQAADGTGAQTPPAADAAGGARVNLTGAGATFPFPLYSRMFDAYGRDTNVVVNYQSIGSGGGQRQILERTVDFGASDTPVTDESLAQAPGDLLHVPTALGAVVPVYNLPGVDERLKLSGDVIADIYLGEITTWNDPAIAGLNSDLTLPALPITVVHRSDGSGTTNVFTEYLSKVSEDWSEQVGSGTAIQWPTGIGAKGNEGVTGVVRSTPGALGYVELNYATQNDLAFAAVRNQAGEFVVADPASVRAAAAEVEVPDDLRVSITNAPGENSWPIGSYTYVLAYEDQQYGGRTRERAQALKDLLEWMVTDGQQFNEALDYARLPEGVQERTLEVIDEITYGDQPLD